MIPTGKKLKLFLVVMGLVLIISGCVGPSTSTMSSEKSTDKDKQVAVKPQKIKQTVVSEQMENLQSDMKTEDVNRALTTVGVDELLKTIDGRFGEIPAYDQKAEKLFAAAGMLTSQDGVKVCNTILIGSDIQTNKVTRALLSVGLDKNYSLFGMLNDSGILDSCKKLYPNWNQIDAFFETELGNLDISKAEQKEYSLDDSKLTIEVTDGDLEIGIVKNGYK